MALVFIEKDFFEEINGTEYLTELLEQEGFDLDWEVTYCVSLHGAIFEQLHFNMN